MYSIFSCASGTLSLYSWDSLGSEGILGIPGIPNFILGNETIAFSGSLWYIKVAKANGRKAGNRMTEQYKAFLEDLQVNDKRLHPEELPSFEEWVEMGRPLTYKEMDKAEVTE